MVANRALSGPERIRRLCLALRQRGVMRDLREEAAAELERLQAVVEAAEPFMSPSERVRPFVIGRFRKAYRAYEEGEQHGS